MFHRNGSSPEAGLSSCVRGLVSQGRYLPQATPATPYMMHLHPTNVFKTFSMRMSNGKPELCDSWNLLAKLVDRGAVQTPYGCTLISVPKLRTRVLVASMGLGKPQPSWPPIQALACLPHITILPRSPVILDSCILWYNCWLEQPQKLSMAKQHRYKALAKHTSQT